MGAITPEERAQVRANSPVGAKYDTPVNRESAAELLAKRAENATAQAKAPPAKTARDDTSAEGGAGQKINDFLFGTGRRQGVVEAAGKQAARTITNRLVRGLLGSLLGGKR